MIVVVRWFCCEKGFVGCRGDCFGYADVERGFDTAGEIEDRQSPAG
jgi:hypothetical protein